MLRIDSNDFNGLKGIVRILKRGGIVCIPTDTAYGLAVDPHQVDAVERLNHLKGRASDNPILLLIDSIEMIETVAILDPKFKSVADQFWPGPITIVTSAKPSLPAGITAGTGSVGVRWPAAAFPLALLRAFGKPVTATSANRSGKSVVRTADEAIEELGIGLDAVVDGGPLTSLRTSTVLDLTSDPPEVLREGQISFNELSAFLDDRLVMRPSISPAAESKWTRTGHHCLA